MCCVVQGRLYEMRTLCFLLGTVAQPHGALPSLLFILGYFRYILGIVSLNIIIMGSWRFYFQEIYFSVASLHFGSSSHNVFNVQYYYICEYLPVVGNCIRAEHGGVVLHNSFVIVCV